MMIFGAFVAVVLAGLIVTGSYLMWFYRPTEALVWQDIRTLHTTVKFGLLTRNLHRWLGWICFVLIPLYAILFVFVGANRSLMIRRRLWRWSVAGFAVGILGLPIAASTWLRRATLRDWWVAHPMPSLVLLPATVLSLVVWRRGQNEKP
jgi:quinol-cytochrome oxidoreductase complex cytochrome b subunit